MSVAAVAEAWRILRGAPGFASPDQAADSPDDDEAAEHDPVEARFSRLEISDVHAEGRLARPFRP